MLYPGAPENLASEATSYLSSAKSYTDLQTSFRLLVEAALKVGELKGILLSFPVAHEKYDTVLRVVSDKLQDSLEYFKENLR